MTPERLYVTECDVIQILHSRSLCEQCEISETCVVSKKVKKEDRLLKRLRNSVGRRQTI